MPLEQTLEVMSAALSRMASEIRMLVLAKIAIKAPSRGLLIAVFSFPPALA